MFKQDAIFHGCNMRMILVSIARGFMEMGNGSLASLGRNQEQCNIPFLHTQATRLCRLWSAGRRACLHGLAARSRIGMMIGILNHSIIRSMEAIPISAGRWDVCIKLADQPMQGFFHNRYSCQPILENTNGHSPGFWIWTLTRICSDEREIYPNTSHQWQCITNVYVCQWAYYKLALHYTHPHTWRMTWTWTAKAFHRWLLDVSQGSRNVESRAITDHLVSAIQMDPWCPLLPRSNHSMRSWTRAAFHEDVQERERWRMCIHGTSSWGHAWKNLSGKDVTWQNEAGMEEWCHSTCLAAWSLDRNGKLAGMMFA